MPVRKASSGSTTAPGYRNKNGQVVVRPSSLPGNDHLQRVYVLRCESCLTEYGANGSDIFQRRCPSCGGGRPGLDFGCTEGSDPVLELLAEAKVIAQRYYKLTQKPLGITGEVAEYEAARILGVKLTPARQAGYDATEISGGKTRMLQIKGRCLPSGCTPGQRLGSIQPDKEWDAVLMVLLDSTFNATEIWEADRAAVLAALAAPGSKARNERGALAITKLKAIGRLRWSLPG